MRTIMPSRRASHILGVATALALGLGGTTTAWAGPDWSCSLSFDAQGAGLQSIIGDFNMQGSGNFDCRDANGESRQVPVTVRLGEDSALSALSSDPTLTVHGAASDLKFDGDPSTVLPDKYLLAPDDSTRAAGTAALHGTQNGVELKLALKQTAGLGVLGDVQAVTLMSPDEDADGNGDQCRENHVAAASSARRLPAKETNAAVVASAHPRRRLQRNLRLPECHPPRVPRRLRLQVPRPLRGPRKLRLQACLPIPGRQGTRRGRLRFESGIPKPSKRLDLVP